MTTGVRNLLWAVFFSIGVSACGSDDDGGSGSSSGSGPVTDVTLTQMAGTWFGTFDDASGGAVQDFEFTVSGGTITGLKLNGTALTGLSGTLTKATETSAPRTFRFVLSDSGGEVTRGVVLVDSAAKHITYVDKFFQAGALQKGTPAALPSYAQADVNQSYSGDRVTTNANFGTVASSRVTGPCAATTPATTPASSECTLALSGSVSRKLSNVQLDSPKGRYLASSYADTPAGTPPPAPFGRLYLTADKKYAAGFTCPQGASDPFACDLFGLSAP